jgi:hypothetical protein
MRKRLATAAFVVAACGGCGTATSLPGPSEPAAPARVPVIPLPTRLPDVISFANTLPLYEYDGTGGGHELDDQARSERDAWLDTRLELPN